MKTEQLLTYGLYGVLLGAAAYLGYTLWTSSQAASPTPLPAQPITPPPAPSSGGGFSVGNALNPIIRLDPVETTGGGFFDGGQTDNSGGGFGVRYTPALG